VLGSTVIAVILLGGCAYASRNVYQEPADGDTGQITIVNHSDFRTSFWLSRNPTVKGDPKAITAFSALPEKTVRVLHKDKIVVSLSLSQSAFAGANQIESKNCSKAYELPFATGDLQITLNATATGCTFRFERREADQPWKVVQEASEWKTPLPID
jgi:hypothetical protein